jgi:hypothetical protein
MLLASNCNNHKALTASKDTARRNKPLCNTTKSVYPDALLCCCGIGRLVRLGKLGSLENSRSNPITPITPMIPILYFWGGIGYIQCISLIYTKM